MWWCVALAVAAAVWLRWNMRRRRRFAMAEKFPGPPTVPILGNALRFMCGAEEMVLELKRLLHEYGDIFRFWLGPDLNFVINNPDDVKLLLSSMKTSVKGPQYKYMASVLGGGILSGSGQPWRKHRKIATPNYGKRAIQSYEEIFNQEVGILLEKYRTVPRGEHIDIYNYIVQSTSYAVCQTLMGLTREQTMCLPYLQEIIDETPELYDIVFDRMMKWYLQIDPIFWLTGSYQQQVKFIKKITDFSKTIIQHRIKTLDMLEDKSKVNLMQSEEDSSQNTQLSVIDRFILSQEIEYDELLKETFTIFTSSQEATAKISSFALLMMAYHPECQAKLYSEIRSVMGTEDRPVTDEDFKQMPYLDMVFNEVVRLFPIGVMLQRTLTEDITISSGTLPADSSLVIPIFHMHRDDRFWDRPDAFDPERFTPENVKKRQPNCYIPFSLGPMDCLGRYFGRKLVKTVVTRVLLHFELTSRNSYKDLRVVMAISAASIDGFHAVLTPRKPL